jgi:hypothetical protein
MIPLWLDHFKGIHQSEVVPGTGARGLLIN